MDNQTLARHWTSRKRQSDEERFFHYIKKQDGDGCWIWIGSKSGGYGQLWLASGIFIRPHRFIYQLTKGPIPDGVHVHHLCGNKSCANPDHLQILSPKEHRNQHPHWEEKVNRTHCKNGHPYDSKNTKLARKGNSNPYRKCRACERLYAKRARQGASC